MARITRQEDSNAYVEYLQRTPLTSCGAQCGERTEFVTLSFWASLEAITAFAGEDIDRAVFYPEDGDYFVDRGTRGTQMRSSSLRAVKPRQHLV